MPPKQKPRSASVVVDSDDDATSLGGLSGPPTPFASRERSRKSLQAPSRKRKRKPTSGDESGLDLVGISLEEMEEAKGFLSSGKPSSKKQKMQTKGGKVSAGSKAKKSRKASKADTNDGTDTDAPEGTIYEPGDGTADIADLYNSRLPKLEEEREKKRKKLANGNQLRAIDSIHGCYIVNLRMTLEANRPVAGYLNLYNTVQLQTVLEICLPELERMAAFEQVGTFPPFPFPAPSPNRWRRPIQTQGPEFAAWLFLSQAPEFGWVADPTQPPKFTLPFLRLLPTQALEFALVFPPSIRGHRSPLGHPTDET